MGAKNAGQTQENFFLDPVKSLKNKRMVNEQCLYIHPLHKSRPRDQTKRRPGSGDENDLRLFRYYHGTEKRESLEAAIQSRIIDMRTKSKYVSLTLRKNCPR